VLLRRTVAHLWDQTRWRLGKRPADCLCIRKRCPDHVLSHWREVNLRHQLTELLSNDLADDALELGYECSEEFLPILRIHQLRQPGVGSVASRLQHSEKQGVPVRRSEPLRRRLKRPNEGDGCDVCRGDSIADRNGKVVEIGAAGGQILDGARDGGHRKPIDPGDVSIRQFALAVAEVQLRALSTYGGGELVLGGQQVTESVHGCRGFTRNYSQRLLSRRLTAGGQPGCPQSLQWSGVGGRQRVDAMTYPLHGATVSKVRQVHLGHTRLGCLGRGH
jgi:hypothetical protein